MHVMELSLRERRAIPRSILRVLRGERPHTAGMDSGSGGGMTEESQGAKTRIMACAFWAALGTKVRGEGLLYAGSSRPCATTPPQRCEPFACPYRIFSGRGLEACVGPRARYRGGRAGARVGANREQVTPGGQHRGRVGLRPLVDVPTHHPYLLPQKRCGQLGVYPVLGREGRLLVPARRVAPTRRHDCILRRASPEETLFLRDGGIPCPRDAS